MGLATLLLLASFAFGNEFQLASEFGYQRGVQGKDGEVSSSLIYAQPSYKASYDGSLLFEFDSKVRGQASIISIEQGQYRTQNEVGLRALSFSVSQNQWRLKGGFQEIPWGETFGFSILDLVNPRDLR